MNASPSFASAVTENLSSISLGSLSTLILNPLNPLQGAACALLGSFAFQSVIFLGWKIRPNRNLTPQLLKIYQLVNVTLAILAASYVALKTMAIAFSVTLSFQGAVFFVALSLSLLVLRQYQKTRWLLKELPNVESTKSSHRASKMPNQRAISSASTRAASGPTAAPVQATQRHENLAPSQVPAQSGPPHLPLARSKTSVIDTQSPMSLARPTADASSFVSLAKPQAQAPDASSPGQLDRQATQADAGSPVTFAKPAITPTSEELADLLQKKASSQREIAANDKEVAELEAKKKATQELIRQLQTSQDEDALSQARETLNNLQTTLMQATMKQTRAYQADRWVDGAIAEERKRLAAHHKGL